MTALTTLGLEKIAQETLLEWLPGFVQVTPAEEVRITWLGENRYRVQSGSLDGGKIFTLHLRAYEER